MSACVTKRSSHLTRPLTREKLWISVASRRVWRPLALPTGDMAEGTPATVKVTRVVRGRLGRRARPSCDVLIVNVAGSIMIGVRRRPANNVPLEQGEARCARFRSRPFP